MIDSNIKLINSITDEQLVTPSFDELVNITICLLNALELEYKINRDEAQTKLGIYCGLINNMVSQNVDKDKK